MIGLQNVTVNNLNIEYFQLTMYCLPPVLQCCAVLQGMRIVHDPKDFDSLLESCKSESKAAFGDDKVLVEKFVDTPRYVFGITLLCHTPLHSIPLCHTPLHSTPLHSTPFHSATLHSTPLHSTPLHSIPLCHTPLHSTPLHSTLLYCTLLPGMSRFRCLLIKRATLYICLREIVVFREDIKKSLKKLQL